MLQDLEDKTAKILSRILSQKRIPKWNSEEFSILILFLLMSHSRTIAMADEMQQMIEKFNRQLMLNVPQFKDIADKVNVKVNDPVLLSLKNATMMHPILMDLKCKLLLNRVGKKPFLLSDHPVALYNQFFEEKKTYGSNTGYSAKGLQLYLPFTPYAGLFLYDSGIYQVGGGHNRPVQIDNQLDVDTLNGIQYLNAFENLFFDNRVISLFAKYRSSSKMEVEQAPLLSNVGTEDGDVIRLYKKDIRCSARFTFVKLTDAALNLRMDNRAIYDRDPFITRLHDKFMKLVDEGKRDPDDFWPFVLDETEAIVKNIKAK